MERNLKIVLLIAFLASMSFSQNVVLFVSNPVNVKAIWPSTRAVVVEAYHSANQPKFLGNKAQWVWIGGRDAWPNGLQIIYQSTIYSDCPNTQVLLSITADNVFTAYLNGIQVGYGSNWQHIFTFKVKLNCGPNVFRVMAKNLDEGTPAAVIYSFTQDQSQCYKCDNPWLAYNKQTCQCQPVHYHHDDDDFGNWNRCLQTNDEDSQKKVAPETAY